MTLALSFINRVLVTAVKHHHWTCRQRPRRWRQIQGKTAQSQRPVASQQPPLEFFIFFNFFCYFLYLFFTFPTNSLRTFSLPFSTLRSPPPLNILFIFYFPQKLPLEIFFIFENVGSIFKVGKVNTEQWALLTVSRCSTLWWKRWPRATKWLKNTQDCEKLTFLLFLPCDVSVGKSRRRGVRRYSIAFFLKKKTYKSHVWKLGPK